MSPVNFDELSEEELKEFVNSPLFQRYRAYKGLAQGIEQLEEDDVMFNQLIKGILRRVTRVQSEETIETILSAFVEEVKEATEMAVDSEEEKNNEWGEA